MGVPVAISTVGSMATANNNTGLATSIALTPATVGNIMVLVIEEKYSSGSNLQVAPGGISGGGVTTWRSAFQRFMVDGVHGVDVWWGVVTSTGSLTATVTYNSTTGQAAGSIDGWELTSTAGANTTWRVDQTGFTDPNTNATTFNYPTLTSALDKEAYIGYLAIASSASAGSGSGWIYTTDLRSNWVASNPNVGVAGTAAMGLRSGDRPGSDHRHRYNALGNVFIERCGSQPDHPQGGAQRVQRAGRDAGQCLELGHGHPGHMGQSLGGGWVSVGILAAR